MLRYTGLSAHDADGKELHAWLEVRGGRLLLNADDAHARYPVVIDPFVQLAELTPSDPTGGDSLGESVAINGNTVVVGGPFATVNGNQFQGAAYVFVEPATGWANMTQTARLTASDGVADDHLGSTVAISGNTVVAGAPNASATGSTHQGSVYVFAEPSGGWVDSTQTAKLVASDPVSNAGLGSSVTTSANTIVAGAPNTPAGGSAYVFVEPKSGWANGAQTAELTATDQSVNLGTAVSISGSTVAAGAPFFGAVYVFVKPMTGWVNMTQTAKLTTVGIGFSVSISGNTIVTGAPDSNLEKGAAYVFVEPSGSWANTSTPNARLTALRGRERDQLGYSVAINGGIVVAGVPFTLAGGTAYLFVEPKSGWVNMTPTSKVNATGGQQGNQFGLAVALSGSTIVAGGPNISLGGDAYVFGGVQ